MYKMLIINTEIIVQLSVFPMFKTAENKSYTIITVTYVRSNADTVSIN